MIENIGVIGLFLKNSSITKELMIADPVVKTAILYTGE